MGQDSVVSSVIMCWIILTSQHTTLLLPAYPDYFLLYYVPLFDCNILELYPVSNLFEYIYHTIPIVRHNALIWSRKPSINPVCRIIRGTFAWSNIRTNKTSSSCFFFFACYDMFVIIDWLETQIDLKYFNGLNTLVWKSHTIK